MMFAKTVSARNAKVSKFDKWLDNQNEATQVYFKNQMKQDQSLILISLGIGFSFGFVLAILMSL